MKRLCVFYKHAATYIGKPIEWIVCRECQKHLHSGDIHLRSGLAHAESVDNQLSILSYGRHPIMRDR